MATSKKQTESNTRPIKIFLRIRPSLENEDTGRYVDGSSSKPISNKYDNQMKFVFDKVFDSACPQVNVYNTTVKPLLSDVISGYNCTVILYGQPVTGKNFTMNGLIPDNDNDTLDKQCGLIPRAASDLFQMLDEVKGQCFVSCNYFGLFNEEPTDYLAESIGINEISIQNDKKGGVIIKGVQNVSVTNKFEIFQLLRKTNKSGSHAIFNISVGILATYDSNELTMGKLSFVIASCDDSVNTEFGSTESIAQRAKNLGQPFSKKRQAAFRDSQLTRILKPSLGGDSITSIITTTAAPNVVNLDEATLEFAQMARSITNLPRINKVSAKVLLDRYCDDNKCLVKNWETQSLSNDYVYMDQTNYTKHLNELSELKKLNNDLEQKVLEKNRAIQERKLTILSECKNVRAYFADIEKAHLELEAKVELIKQKIINIRNEVPKFVLEIQNSLREKHTNLFEKLFEKRKQLEENFNRNLETHLEKHIDTLVSLQRCHLDIGSFQDETETHKELQQFMSGFNKSMSSMDSILSDTNYFDHSTKLFSSCESAIEALKNRGTKTRLDLQKKLTGKITKHNLIRSKKRQMVITRKMQSLKNNADVLLTNRIIDRRKTVNKFQQLNHLLQSMIDEKHSCSTFLEDYTTVVFEQCDQEEIQIKKLGKTLNDELPHIPDALFKFHKKFSSTRSKEDLQYGPLVRELNDFAPHFIKHKLNLSLGVENLQKELRGANTSIVEVKHAGDTPARVNSKPVLLKDLTPKEEVLFRFQKMQLEEANASEDVEEAGCSSSTTPKR